MLIRLEKKKSGGRLLLIGAPSDSIGNWGMVGRFFPAAASKGEVIDWLRLRIVKVRRQAPSLLR